MPTPKSYRYRVVDVFTQVPLEGNALAVFPDAKGIDDTTKQKIARELNLSETVFVDDATLPGCLKSFQIFTPTKEMIFAGHPTVGASYVLWKEGLVPQGIDRFLIQEKIGPVTVHLEFSDPPLVWLETPPIAFEVSFSAGVCANILRLPVSDLLDVEPQIVNAGNPTLLVAVRDRAAVDRACLDPGLFSELASQSPAPFCMFVFTPTPAGAYSRMFAPNYGIQEDPATGSSTGPLAAFMKRYKMLPEPCSGRFVNEQGTKMGRRSLLHFEIPAAQEERISVGGCVTPLIEGVLTL